MASKARASAYLRITCATLALLAPAAVTASPASAQEPCWRTLVRDWSDGAISNLYPIQCYRQALRNMPEDVRLYSSASDDINRALSGRVASRGVAGAGGLAGSAPQAAVAATGGSSSSTSLVLAGSLAALLAMAVGGGYLLQRKGRAAAPPGGRSD